MNPAIEGGCLCGGVRYRLDQVPWDTNDCHCLDCRRSRGAPVVTWGSGDRERLTLAKGEGRGVPPAGRVRSFAACCGTHLFFEEEPDARTVDVTLATLDNPVPYPPEIAIWTEDR